MKKENVCPSDRRRRARAPGGMEAGAGPQEEEEPYGFMAL